VHPHQFYIDIFLWP